MISDRFVVNDFMSGENIESPDTTTGQKEKLKIPSFLDATVKAEAANVIYDNITLKNVSGSLQIKDQAAALNNMKSNVFGGQLGFDGVVSTKTDNPMFTMKLDIENFDIGESFTSLELFQALAPIAGALQGKINTAIELSGTPKG